MLTPVLGRAGDIHGKSRVLTGVMAILAAGTLIAALASSLPVMLLGRVIQGAGGAVYPLAFGIVREELPPERVPGGIGLVSSLLGIGAGLGLVVPGFILEHLSYHWLFWLPLMVLVPTTALTARCVPPSPGRVTAPINWISALLMGLGLGAVLVAISETAAWGWGSPRTLGLATAGVLLVSAWVRQRAARRRAARRHAHDGHPRRVDGQPRRVPARRRDVLVDRGHSRAGAAPAAHRRSASAARR